MRNVYIDMIHSLRIKVMDVPDDVPNDLVYAVARLVCDLIEDPSHPELRRLSAGDFNLQMDENSFRELVGRIARSTYIEELDTELLDIDSRRVD